MQHEPPMRHRSACVRVRKEIGRAGTRTHLLLLTIRLLETRRVPCALCETANAPLRRILLEGALLHSFTTLDKVPGNSSWALTVSHQLHTSSFEGTVVWILWLRDNVCREEIICATRAAGRCALHCYPQWRHPLHCYPFMRLGIR